MPSGTAIGGSATVMLILVIGFLIIGIFSSFVLVIVDAVFGNKIFRRFCFLKLRFIGKMPVQIVG